MKILFYNIQYGTGINQGGWRYPLSLWKYLFSGKAAINKLKKFIQDINPDILAVDEIDNGSPRTWFSDQVKFLADNIFKFYYFACKYSNFLGSFPFFKNQGNAFFSKHSGQFFTHRVSGGVKDLVIEFNIENKLSIFLVHLSLGGNARGKQLSKLSEIIKQKTGGVVVLGDFNAEMNDKNIKEFLIQTKLSSVNNKNSSTFPSWSPSRSIDHFFVSNNVAVNSFEVLDNVMSDHLPILLECSLHNADF